MSLKEFKNWINAAEQTDTIPLKDSKENNSWILPGKITDHEVRNIDEITGFIAYINSEPLSAISVGIAYRKQLSGLKKILTLSGNA